MKNEKEKKRSNPIDEAVDKAKDWAKSKISKAREKIEKSKTTRTKDRRFSDLTDAFLVPEELREEHFRRLESRK